MLPSPSRRFLLAAVTACIATVPLATPLEAQKPRVAVLDFENRSTWWRGYLGGGAAEVMTTKLVESGAFQVVERSRLQSILSEQQLQLSGAVDPATVNEIGRLLGVDYLITGSVTSFNIQQRGGTLRAIGVGASYTEASTTMNARMFSTETAEIVAAAEAEGEERLGLSVRTRDFSVNENSRYNPQLANEALSPTVDEIVEKFVEQSGDLVANAAPPAPPATIVGERENQIYIDRGEAHGVEVGQRYSVLRVVDEIVGTDGTVLDVITEQVGVLRVEQVLSQSSVCVIVEGEAAEGDTLEPAGD